MTKYYIFTITSPLGYLTFLGTIPEIHNPNKIEVYQAKYGGKFTIVSLLLDDQTVGNTLKSAFLARRKGPINKLLGYSPEFKPLKLINIPGEINGLEVKEGRWTVRRKKATFTKDAK